jgi:hypothetical protein
VGREGGNDGGDRIKKVKIRRRGKGQEEGTNSVRIGRGGWAKEDQGEAR